VSLEERDYKVLLDDLLSESNWNPVIKLRMIKAFLEAETK